MLIGNIYKHLNPWVRIWCQRLALTDVIRS